MGKADTALQSYTESDPIFTASAAHGITSTNITNWNNKISEPASEGINGQALITDGNGGRTWGNVGTGITFTSTTITAADWSNFTATKNVTGVTASNNVDVSPDPSCVPLWRNNAVYCSAQGTGTLTFTAGITPTEAMTINIKIYG